MTVLVAAVNDAMAQYAVLVIRDQHISDEDQVRFARRFRPLELPPHMGLKGAHGLRRIAPELYDVSNLAAYDALPGELKKRAHGAVAEHYFWKTRGRAGYTVVTDEMRRAMPPVQHSVVRVVPESGRSALYIGEHTAHIVGWPQEKGEAFLNELNRFATQPQFIYTHKWRAGDLVIWDNRCTLHRATGYDVYKYKRDLRRATINEYGAEISSTDAIGVPESPPPS